MLQITLSATTGFVVLIVLLLLRPTGLFGEKP